MQSALSAVARNRLGHLGRASKTPFFRRKEKVKRVAESPIGAWFAVALFHAKMDAQCKRVEGR